MASPSDQVPSLLREAQAAHDRGDRHAALRAYAAVLAFDSRHPVAANSLGMAALQRGDAVEAERLFALAAVADPAAPELRMNLASARRARGDAAGERAALEGALGIDQRHVMANVRLAELHDRLEQSGEAMFRWNGVVATLDAVPDRGDALDQLLAHARAQLERGSRRLADAIDGGLVATRGTFDARERRRFEACVDATLGRRRIYRHEPHGLHFPFLPADEFFDEALFPWMAELEARTPAIRRELEALLAAPDSGFAPYVPARSGAPASRWTALAGSPAWSARYLWRYGVRGDEVCARCPETAAAVERLPLAAIPGRGPTAFFSILQPGARLPAHTGVSNVRAIVHLPLIVPPGCGFRVGGETRQWVEGRAFAFDDTIEHEAWNDSDAIRAVLILDVWNPHLTDAEQAMLRELFQLLPSIEDAPAGAASA